MESKIEFIDEFLDPDRLSSSEMLDLLEDNIHLLDYDDILELLDTDDIKSYIEDKGYYCFDDYDSLVDILENDYDEVAVDADEMENIRMNRDLYFLPPYKLKEFFTDMLGLHRHVSVDIILNELREKLK